MLYSGLRERISQMMDCELVALKKQQMYVVSGEAWQFIAMLLDEAVQFRLAEGESIGVEVNDQAELLEYFREAIQQLVVAASELEQYEITELGPVISLISIMEVIARGWCNIWPFCRPTPRPRLSQSDPIELEASIGR